MHLSASRRRFAVVLSLVLWWGACSFTRPLGDLQRGTTAGQDARGQDGQVGDGDGGVVYPPRTIQISGGDNHFAEAETFPTSTFDHAAYVAWDREHLYFGVEGKTIESNDPATWVLAYFGSSGGTAPRTRSGQSYGSQTPVLGFDASYHMRWKGDDNFISLMRFGAGGWQEGSAFPGQHQRKGRLVVFSLPLKQLIAQGDNPDTLAMVMTMIRENSPETTYASLPEGAVSPDGAPNPPYTQFFPFDLSGNTLPNRHQAQ